MSTSLVYITCGSTDEARRIARTLIEERLAACTNLIEGMRTCYRWEGEIQEDQETILIAKTADGRVAALTRRVKALHSYDLPCVLALPIAGGNSAFTDWIEAETRAEE